MDKKTLPFNKEKIQELVKSYPTPFYIYDEKGIRDNAKELKDAFKNVNGFKEYFAVKATPNPHILKILKEEGFGADCSSFPELLLAEKIGIVGEDIMFTSNDTPEKEFVKANELGAIINLDDISHIDFLEKAIDKLPELICFRFNPGSERTGNSIIGDPSNAKYGFTREQLFEGYKICRDKGVKRFGLHTMVISNELDYNYFIETVRMLLTLVGEIKEKLDINIEFINIGGGIGIPYQPNQKKVSYKAIAEGIEKAYYELIENKGLNPVRIVSEFGRVITGPYGYLISTVRHLKHTYKDYVGLDSCMADLMRPALYGAYHHLTILGKESENATHKYDVTGSLCENNDKFAIDRMLPEIKCGDIVVQHDAGAHGHAMGFNYNGKLRIAEILIKEDGNFKLIRRAENINDYFSTLDFSEFDYKN